MNSQLVKLLALLILPISSLAQDINFDDLRRTGAPLVKSYSVSGAGAEGSSAIMKFEDMDTQRVLEHNAQRKAYADSKAGSAGTDYCGASDTCFVPVSIRKMAATIQCTKGMYRGEKKDICSNSKGKWASGCGFSEIFAHHYDFSGAGNRACGR